MRPWPPARPRGATAARGSSRSSSGPSSGRPSPRRRSGCSSRRCRSAVACCASSTIAAPSTRVYPCRAAFSLLVMALVVLLRAAGPGDVLALANDAGFPRPRVGIVTPRGRGPRLGGARELPPRHGLAPARRKAATARATRGRRRAAAWWCWHWRTRRTARPWPRPATTRRSSCGTWRPARVVGRLEGHGDAVSCLAFSPDGKTLATGSYDRTVKLWDVATGRETSHARGAHQLDLRRRLRARRRSRWPRRGTTRRCGSGTSPPAGRRPNCRATRLRSGPWRSPPTANGVRLATGGADRQVLILGPENPLGPCPARRP